MDQQQFSWLAELPNEILLEIFDQLDRLQLTRLMRVNKRICSLAQYILEHKKKIRLCGDKLRVLVLGFNSIKTSSAVYRVVQRFMADPYLSRDQIKDRTVVHNYMHSTDGKSREINLIRADTDNIYRQLLWLTAVAADLLLFVVDPKEIDEHSEEIKEIVFGSCFMMSARNVIVAVDLYHDPSEHAFDQARTKIAKLLDDAVGQCYTIIPVDSDRDCNIRMITTFKWFKGPSLKQLLIEDQLRTNFDETAYKKLREEPIRVQITDCHRIGGIGSASDGHVLCGVLKPKDDVRLFPTGTAGTVSSIEINRWPAREARPSDVIGVNARGIGKYQMLRRIPYMLYAANAEVNVTLAFRASIAVKKSDRFMLHHVYTVFYGAARIRCILWWIFPEDGKNHDKHERKFKLERHGVSLPQKPKKHKLDEETYKREMQQFKLEVSKLVAEHASGYVRPMKPTFKKAKAILLPLHQYDIETYKPSVFEKNYSGKVMLVEKGSVVGVGQVDRAIRLPHINYNKPTEVINNAALLFSLPEEQLLHDLFLDHVKNNKHAKRCIKQLP